jgi:hypothetical protein
VTQGTGSAEINCTDGSSATIFDGLQGPAGEGVQEDHFYLRRRVQRLPSGFTSVQLNCVAGDKAIGAYAVLEDIIDANFTTRTKMKTALSEIQVFESQPLIGTEITTHKLYNSGPEDTYKYTFSAVCVSDEPRPVGSYDLFPPCLTAPRDSDDDYSLYLCYELN